MSTLLQSNLTAPDAGWGPRGRRSDAAACAAGMAVTSLAALGADRHPPLDRWVFETLNDHASEPVPVRLVQQLGTPWILPAHHPIDALGGAALGIGTSGGLNWAMGRDASLRVRIHA